MTEWALPTDKQGHFRNLIRESKDDDVALECARLLLPYAVTSSSQIDIAQVFVHHRQFEQALALYRQASSDPTYEAESRYQTGRVQFQLQNYPAAIEVYRTLAKDFEGSAATEVAWLLVAHLRLLTRRLARPEKC